MYPKIIIYCGCKDNAFYCHMSNTTCNLFTLNNWMWNCLGNVIVWKNYKDHTVTFYRLIMLIDIFIRLFNSGLSVFH